MILKQLNNDLRKVTVHLIVTANEIVHQLHGRTKHKRKSKTKPSRKATNHLSEYFTFYMKRLTKYVK